MPQAQPYQYGIPGRRTPSFLYFQLYRLAAEHQRLSQEVRLLNRRQTEIKTRLEGIRENMLSLEQETHRAFHQG